VSKPDQGTNVTFTVNLNFKPKKTQDKMRGIESSEHLQDEIKQVNLRKNKIFGGNIQSINMY